MFGAKHDVGGRTKKITFCFVKHLRKKMHKNLLLSLSRTKTTFSFTFFTLCFNSRKRKQYIKNCKILCFFTILRVLILRRGKCTHANILVGKVPKPASSILNLKS